VKKRRISSHVEFGKCGNIADEERCGVEKGKGRITYIEYIRMFRFAGL
jgi:hypothetical protein